MFTNSRSVHFKNNNIFENISNKQTSKVSLFSRYVNLVAKQFSKVTNLQKKSNKREGEAGELVQLLRKKCLIIIDIITKDRF